MAPEQFRGAAQPSSDLYALGATLLYMLTGEWIPWLSLGTMHGCTPYDTGIGYLMLIHLEAIFLSFVQADIPFPCPKRG